VPTPQPKPERELAATPPGGEELDALGIASTLIRARNEQGMTQATLAEVSGVSRSAIKGYETGRNMPGSRELKQLCRALKVTPNALLFGSENPDFASEPNALRDILDEPESAASGRVRLAALSALLTNDEQGSLLKLVQSLTIARHGIEVVRQHAISADLMIGLQRAWNADAQRVATGAASPDPERIVKEAEEFVSRQAVPGDGSDAPKVTKK
jgi:transcriptional regulator with XRE-family HTH domain